MSRYVITNKRTGEIVSPSRAMHKAMRQLKHDVIVIVTTALVLLAVLHY